MMNTCAYFGIYPESIEDANEVVQRTLQHFGLSDKYDDTMEFAEEELTEEGIDPSVSITDRIIYVMFHSCKDTLRENGINSERIDYFVNGIDSHFYVDKEEM